MNLTGHRSMRHTTHLIIDGQPPQAGFIWTHREFMRRLGINTVYRSGEYAGWAPFSRQCLQVTLSAYRRKKKYKTGLTRGGDKQFQLQVVYAVTLVVYALCKILSPDLSLSS